MTRKIDRIESRVKGQVDDTVESVKHAFDIGDHVAERPWVALGASFVVGCLLAGVERPAPHARGSAWRSDEPWRTNGARRDGDAGFASSGVVSGAASAIADVRDDLVDRFGDEFEVVKTAAVATLAGLAREWLSETLPHFGQQFERARQSRVQRTQPSPSTPAPNSAGGI